MSAYQHIDFTYLDSLIDGDVETKQVILSTLLEEVPEEIEKIRTSLTNEHWNELHELSHKLKSTLAYIGNDTIFNENQNIMMAARNLDNLAAIPTWFENVENQWALIEPELQDALENL